ncbi:MAG: hypothetical protein R2836_05710 [Chitinophagales bacterium]
MLGLNNFFGIFLNFVSIIATSVRESNFEISNSIPSCSGHIHPRCFKFLNISISFGKTLICKSISNEVEYFEFGYHSDGSFSGYGYINYSNSWLDNDEDGVSFDNVGMHAFLLITKCSY